MGRFQIYWRIVVPMSKSVIVMTMLLNFLASWNNFMGPLIYLSDWNQMTLPIGLRVLQGYMGTGSIGVVLAGVPHFRSCAFAGEFPLASLQLETEQFPWQLTMTAFNPFIPTNEDDSSIPGAFFEFGWCI